MLLRAHARRIGLFLAQLAEIEDAEAWLFASARTRPSALSPSRALARLRVQADAA
jgi:hypothetical protein